MAQCELIIVSRTEFNIQGKKIDKSESMEVR